MAGDPQGDRGSRCWACWAQDPQDLVQGRGTDDAGEIEALIGERLAARAPRRTMPPPTASATT